MSKWKDLRKELDITPEEENVIELEKELIRAMVTIREEQGLSQAELQVPPEDRIPAERQRPDCCLACRKPQ